MHGIADQLALPGCVETVRLGHRLVQADEDLAVQPSRTDVATGFGRPRSRAGIGQSRGLSYSFRVVKGDHIRRAFVAQEGLVQTSYFGCGHDVNDQIEAAIWPQLP